MKYIFVIVLILIALLNFYVTYKILINDSLEKIQKLVFSFIVWLIPLIGAFGVLLFLKDDETPKGPRNTNNSLGAGSMGDAHNG